MTRKPKYRDISDIIEGFLKPRLEMECQKLGIPEQFVAGIYSIYPQPFFYASCCEPVEEHGKIVAVRIRIDSEIRSSWVALIHFWHELRHAKDLYENRPSPEWRVHLYVFRRCLGGPFVRIFRPHSVPQSVSRPEQKTDQQG